MSGAVGQVANLPGQIGNLPHDITYLRPNSLEPTATACLLFAAKPTRGQKFVYPGANGDGVPQSRKSGPKTLRFSRARATPWWRGHAKSCAGPTGQPFSQGEENAWPVAPAGQGLRSPMFQEARHSCLAVLGLTGQARMPVPLILSEST
jgi:hypothetical protein